jgi:hypothetical protein
VLWAGFLRGDREAQEQLLAACYHELRSIARALLAREPHACRPAGARGRAAAAALIASNCVTVTTSSRSA